LLCRVRKRGKAMPCMKGSLMAPGDRVDPEVFT
jgi:hypothetical protein